MKNSKSEKKENHKVKLFTLATVAIGMLLGGGVVAGAFFATSYTYPSDTKVINLTSTYKSLSKEQSSTTVLTKINDIYSSEVTLSKSGNGAELVELSDRTVRLIHDVNSTGMSVTITASYPGAENKSVTIQLLKELPVVPSINAVIKGTYKVGQRTTIEDKIVVNSLGITSLIGVLNPINSPVAGISFGNWEVQSDIAICHISGIPTEAYNGNITINGTNNLSTSVVLNVLPENPILAMTVDTTEVFSTSATINGTVTLTDLPTGITSLTLAPKTADNDNDMFESWSWISGNNFTVHAKGINGAYNLQVQANGTILSNSTSITVNCFNVPDNTYYAVDVNGTITTGKSTNTDDSTLDIYNQSPKLRTLIIGRTPALKTLNCSDNSLTSLDISRNPTLTALFCYKNSLSTLDINNNSALTSLVTNKNFLKTLDVSKNPAIRILDCGDNSLSTISVNKNPNLEYFSCIDNSLNAVDVSKNLTLIDFHCTGNTLLNDIELPMYTAGSYNFLWNDLAVGNAPSGTVFYTSAYTTVLNAKPSGWNLISR